ncbi:MAG: 6-bladed beta-propeller [Parabacteroides sp.]
MKSIYTILVILLTIMAGCGNNKKSDCQKEDSDAITIPDTFITIDVSKKYPLKELILQDIMDVEYITLESTDEFLCQGIVQAIGKEIILVKNVINDGDIFIFDRNGKGLRKFNRKGQGSEEYIFNLSAFIDDNSGEIYIDEIIRNVLVYDFQGNFLKSIPRGDNKWINATNYNQDYLIARESPSIQIQIKRITNVLLSFPNKTGTLPKIFESILRRK